MRTIGIRGKDQNCQSSSYFCFTLTQVAAGVFCADESQRICKFANPAPGGNRSFQRRHFTVFEQASPTANRGSLPPLLYRHPEHNDFSGTFCETLMTFEFPQESSNQDYCNQMSLSGNMRLILLKMGIIFMSLCGHFSRVLLFAQGSISENRHTQCESRLRTQHSRLAQSF